jgi:hypothetical protein
MRLLYVIDNQTHRMADVLNTLLRDERVHPLGVASAYFNVGGFDLLREGSAGLASFRMFGRDRERDKLYGQKEETTTAEAPR